MVSFGNRKLRHAVVAVSTMAGIGAVLLLAHSTPAASDKLADALTPAACMAPSQPAAVFSQTEIGATSSVTAVPVSNYFQLNDNNSICFAGVPQLVVDRLPLLAQASNSQAQVSEASAQQASAVQANAQSALLGESGSLQLAGQVLAKTNFHESGDRLFWIFIYYSSQPLVPHCPVLPSGMDCAGHFITVFVDATTGYSGPDTTGLQVGS